MKENTGKTRFVLLGLLARGPQTGYTIKKAIEYEYRHFWQESFGQIYPTLKSLVMEGLAASIESPESQDSRGKITYRITEAGQSALDCWLCEAPSVEKLRYEILLKVSFGASSAPETILGHLDEFIKRNETCLREMDGFLEMFRKCKAPAAHYLNSELTALCGKYFYTAMKDWALDAQSRILSGRGTANETTNP